ncbi:alpha/beta hydrolase [Rhodanobacter geophilus]|uniref:Alpha/beta hydrolase n=1 Tax=Rhodanobacter geophilus TaxID=3162488 RepID=A0ABV3QT31_9GAMM
MPGSPGRRPAPAAWGSERVDIGDAGHVNAASGLGEWPQGLALLQGLIAAA